MAFSFIEFVLYLLPVIFLWIILENKRALVVNHRIHLRPVDLMHPVLWVCFHILTEMMFHYSLIPLYVLVVSLLALIYLVHLVGEQDEFQWGSFLRFLSNTTFSATFLIYYLFVIYRIISFFI